MDRRILYIGGGVGLLALLYFIRKGSSSNSGTTVTPNAPTSIVGNADVQGVTDAAGNLLPQFQWPYNQMALPYNYSSSNINGTNPASQTFIGYQTTPAVA